MKALLNDAISMTFYSAQDNVPGLDLLPCEFVQQVETSYTQTRQTELLRSRALLISELPHIHPSRILDLDNSTPLSFHLPASLSHKNGHLLLGLFQSPLVHAAGVDIEVEHAVTEKVFQRVSTPAEAALLKSYFGEADQWPTLSFSLKESLVKMASKSANQKMRFNQIEMTEISDARIRLKTPFENSIVQWTKGRIEAHGLLYTACWQLT